MDGSRNAIQSFQLVDMGNVGNDFTWTDNREKEVRCRLDPAFSTNSWLRLFSMSRVCHLLFQV